MIISLIAAMDRNRLIGRKNSLPWHLPEDFKHFKAVTIGKPVVMGRKTFESIGKPLPGRTNIVLSRSGFQSSGVIVVTDINHALSEVAKSDEVMIIGGADLYQQTIDLADRMYLTHVDGIYDGDAWFPAFDEHDWHVTMLNHFDADDRNNHDFSIKEYNRKR